jgi:hypothetical protein
MKPSRKNASRPRRRGVVVSSLVASPDKPEHVDWLKLAVGKGEGSYLELALDDTRKVTWTIQPDHLSDETWYRYNEYAVFPLAKGLHRLALTNKTPHTVQKLLITNDLSFAPEGHINMPTGW